MKKKVDAVDDDEGPDDFLKLDATAEVDEFSQFLNEFEDEVLDESKKKEAVVDVKKVKKDRPVTEKKIVDGKKMRKKVDRTSWKQIKEKFYICSSFRSSLCDCHRHPQGPEVPEAAQ